MTREIKFRGWNASLKQMIDNVVSLTKDTHLGSEHYSISTSSVACDEVMQYTGLLDKNGVMIYEGDIVEFDEIEWGGKDNIHIVTWDNKQGAWCWAGGNSSDMKFRKVIGNIYEHKHLLDTEFKKVFRNVYERKHLLAI